MVLIRAADCNKDEYMFLLYLFFLYTKGMEYIQLTKEFLLEKLYV